MEVPVIDISKLQGKNRSETMAEIARACEEWGFFQLLNHGIAVDLLERVKKVCHECFKLEREKQFSESAQAELLNELESGGANPGDSLQQLKNSDWEDVFTLFDDNKWPSQPPEFKSAIKILFFYSAKRETMEEYRREVKKLGERMMEIMDENLSLEKGHIKRVFHGPDHQPLFGTKVSHYPPCPSPDKVPGLRAHTDAGGVILLFQDDQVKGLQVLKGGEWFDVSPLANAIVINTGDQIEVLSNGRYKSAWHRVVASKHGNRRSIASFYNPSLSATIAPAPELVDQENKDEKALVYPKFVFGDYMDIYAEQKFLPKEPRFHAVGVN